jgi:hypothetical protein
MPRPRPHLLLAALSVFLLSALPAAAQDEGGEPVPEAEHPGSDSPEAVTAAQARTRAGRRRAQAFLIPLDEKARAATGRVASAIEKVLAGSKQYDVIDLAKALASDAEPEQEAKAGEGRRLLAEANQKFESRSYIDAVPRFRTALKAMHAGLSGLEGRELADATLRLATAQLLAGDQKGARLTFLEAALLDPQGKLHPSSADPAAEGPYKLARADLESVPIGALQVVTQPAGARVFIDGQPLGVAPARLELTGGKHIVRLERTGFYPTAELVEVTSRRETVYSIRLNATPGASQVNQLIAGTAEEASRGKTGERTARLADRFHLERVLIGSVRAHGLKISVMLGLADPIARVLLGKEDLLMTADGTDSDQVEADVQHAARKLIAIDDERSAAQATAPGAAPAAPAPAAPAASNYGGMVPGDAAAQAAPAPAEGARRAVVPGSAPRAPEPDDTGVVSKERKVAAPSAVPAAVPNDEAPAKPAAQAADAPPAERPAEEEKPAPKKKGKGIKAKSGTEKWDDE